jgi:hypothetical protein
MRRIGLIAMAFAALALAVPGAALAQGRSHHPKKSHHVKRSHRVRSHTRRFVASNPTAPPTITPSDNAGTVASFTNGVLTLTLNDGSTVSGKVTDATEIECQSVVTATGDARTRTADHGPGGDQDGGDQNDANGGGDQGEDNGGANGATCDSTALVARAVVHEADLKVDSTGATFRKIELVK